MSPTQARSAQAVAEIVEAARKRFGDHGYDATSIDDIAADAGRTKGAVYHHFADKRSLFERVFRDEQRRIAARVAKVGNLQRGVASYLQTIATAPGSARITLIDGPAVLGWATWRSCDDGPFREMLRGSLAVQDGLSERYDLDQLADLLLGAITEAAIHVASASRPKQTARNFGAQLDQMLTAIIG